MDSICAKRKKCVAKKKPPLFSGRGKQFLPVGRGQDRIGHSERLGAIVDFDRRKMKLHSYSAYSPTSLDLCRWYFAKMSNSNVGMVLSKWINHQAIQLVALALVIPPWKQPFAVKFGLPRLFPLASRSRQRYGVRFHAE
jgi:hypothetical protein